MYQSQKTFVNIFFNLYWLYNIVSGIIRLQLNNELHLKWWDPHGAADAKRWTAQSKKEMLFISIGEISQQGKTHNLSWFATELISFGVIHRVSYSCPETSDRSEWGYLFSPNMFLE